MKKALTKTKPSNAKHDAESKKARNANVDLYNTIKRAIINWELKPAEQLVEETLAERLSASRTPVREALHRLAQDGFVEIVPRRGAQVSCLSVHDIQELLQIREALEGMATGIAVLNFSDAELDYMLSYAQDCRNNPEKDDGAQIHALIHKACRNGRLIKLINIYKDQIDRVHHLVLRLPNRLDHSTREHLAICQAMKKRNSVLAESEMRKHISNLRVQLTDMLLNLKWDSLWIMPDHHLDLDSIMKE